MTIPSDAVRRAVRYNGRSSCYVWFISDEWRQRFDIKYAEFDRRESAMSALMAAVEIS